MTFTKRNTKFVKVLILCVMIIMVGAGNAYAHGHEDKCPHHGKECITHKHSFMKTHINMYYELLAEKYAPDQVKVWQEIAEEREVLRKKLKDAHVNGKIQYDEKTIASKWYEEHGELQKKFENAIKNRKAKDIEKLIPELFKHHQKLNNIYKEELKKLQ